MAKINLSRIHFRPYSDSEIPTEYGFGDHIETPGAIDLSNIQFRPYEDNGYSSIGGSGSNDSGGGGDPGGEQGAYSMFINSAGTDRYAENTITLSNLYLYAELYIPAANYAAMVAGGGTPNYRGEFLDIGEPGSPGWYQGLFLSPKNTLNVEDGNLYFWDYWSPATAKVLSLPDIWTIIEIGIESVGANYQATFKINGIMSNDGWNNIGSIPAGDIAFSAGLLFTTNLGEGWYIDNVKASTVNWITDGGTPFFEDDFETGDFSNWDTTVGSPSVAPPP